MDLRLIGAKGQTLLAYLQVRAQRTAGESKSPALQGLKTDSLGRLGRAGVTLAGPVRPLSEKDDPRAAAAEGWLGGFAATGRWGAADVDTRIGFVERPGVTFSFMLISPLMRDDSVVAMRALRALEIARSTVRLTK